MLTIFAKRSIIIVWEGSEYAPAIFAQSVIPIFIQAYLDKSIHFEWFMNLVQFSLALTHS